MSKKNTPSESSNSTTSNQTVKTLSSYFTLTAAALLLSAAQNMPAVATSPASVEHDARPRQVEEEKADIELEEGVRQSLEQQGKLKSNLQQQPFQLRTVR